MSEPNADLAALYERAYPARRVLYKSGTTVDIAHDYPISSAHLESWADCDFCRARADAATVTAAIERAIRADERRRVADGEVCPECGDSADDFHFSGGRHLRINDACSRSRAESGR